MYIQSEHLNSSDIQKIEKPVFINKIEDDTTNNIVNSMLELDETDLQRHINEEFANLSLSNCHDENNVYAAFSKEGIKGEFGINGTAGVGVPRFYKYFQ